MIREEGLQKIGTFAKPHGVKGEISLVTDYDLSGMKGATYMVCSIDNICVPFFFESIRPKNASVTLVKFENLDSEEKVKFLTGRPAYMPADLVHGHDDRPTDRNYLIGYAIVDNRSGLIGVVNDVDDSTPNVLLKVDYKGNDILIPVELITSIQYKRQTISTSLPDGFFSILYNY